MKKLPAAVLLAMSIFTVHAQAQEQAAPEPAAVPATATAPVATVPATSSAPGFSIPAGRIEASLGRIKGEPGRIAYLPVIQLQWAMRNKVAASGGVFNKHKSSKEIFSPVDQAVLERVLVALQDDLAARFEAVGWQAITRAELGADVPQVSTLGIDAKAGVPVSKYDDRINAQDWAVIALPGSAPINPKSIGNGMALGRFLKGKAGVNLNMTYSFAPGSVKETRSKMLQTAADSSLAFSARADLMSAKGGWGNINTDHDEGPVEVDGDIGTLAEIAGSKAGVAENMIRYFAGMGTRDRTGYQFTPDWSQAEAAMLRAGKAFNAEVVARLAQ